MTDFIVICRSQNSGVDIEKPQNAGWKPSLKRIRCKTYLIFDQNILSVVHCNCLIDMYIVTERLHTYEVVIEQSLLTP